MTDKVRDLLQSLNLPGSLQALEKPLGIPGWHLSHQRSSVQGEAD